MSWLWLNYGLYIYICVCDEYWRPCLFLCLICFPFCLKAWLWHFISQCINPFSQSILNYFDDYPSNPIPTYLIISLHSSSSPSLYAITTFILVFDLKLACIDRCLFWLIDIDFSRLVFNLGRFTLTFGWLILVE